MSYFRGPNIIKDGLVLYLDAGNIKSYPTSGTTFNNLIGTSNNGTLNNGPTFNSNNNGNIVFDGVDDFIIISGNTALQPSLITLECIFQRNSGRTIISYSSDSPGSAKTYSFQIPDVNLQATIFTTTGSININGPIINLNTWYHAALTYNNSVFSLYVNGILQTSSILSSSFSYSVNNNLNIGRKNSSDGEYVNGRVSIIRIYNRALSATEIYQNYEATKVRFNI